MGGHQHFEVIIFVLFGVGSICVGFMWHYHSLYMYSFHPCFYCNHLLPLTSNLTLLFNFFKDVLWYCFSYMHFLHRPFIKGNLLWEANSSLCYMSSHTCEIHVCWKSSSLCQTWPLMTSLSRDVYKGLGALRLVNILPLPSQPGCDFLVLELARGLERRYRS